jgi:ATP-binding cassette subfamily F protein 3
MQTIEVETEENAIGFSFSKPTRSGHVVLKLEEVGKTYGENVVFHQLDLEVTRGDRIAVVGVNGAGKSTLASSLAGAEPFQAGTRTVGHKVELSFFAQNQADALDPEATVLDLASESAEEDLRTRVRDVLGSFLFRGDDVFKKSSVLSGGEKNRLALARMLLQPANCMIFDEPTNHLDMRSKEVLQRALAEYSGTMVIVSHDRAFINPLVNRVLEMTSTGMRSFPGNVSDYLARLAVEEKYETGETGAQAPACGENVENRGESPRKKRRREAEKRQMLAPYKAKADRLEQQIARLEREVAEYETAMADPEFFQKGDATTEGIKHYDSLKRKLERAMRDWEKSNLEIERIGGEV